MLVLGRICKALVFSVVVVAMSGAGFGCHTCHSEASTRFNTLSSAEEFEREISKQLMTQWNEYGLQNVRVVDITSPVRNPGQRNISIETTWRDSAREEVVAQLVSFAERYYMGYLSSENVDHIASIMLVFE